MPRHVCPFASARPGKALPVWSLFIRRVMKNAFSQNPYPLYKPQQSKTLSLETTLELSYVRGGDS
jgi:hypothetical protein